MDINDFKAMIKPFFWVEHNNSFSVCLNAGDYKPEIFETRAEEGFEGNGYDWASLAQGFLDEKKPDLSEDIKFDPEAGMFCAYSSNAESLKEFISEFKKACEDDAVIQDLFSKAKLD
ncbi:immunity 51 family protein [Chryseobacterium tongliaoense]|uniref:immunity 51 family protein n=1 Tax=Chryseobacterium tongliaoense TaxID=3240933 RepID=UPI003517E7B2